jgi:hypothetical protein
VDRSLEAGPPVLEEPVLKVVGAEDETGSGSKRRSRKRKSSVAAERDTGIDAGPRGVLEETRRAGTRQHPGRTFRVRGI